MGHVLRHLGKLLLETRWAIKITTATKVITSFQQITNADMRILPKTFRKIAIGTERAELLQTLSKRL